MTRDKQIVRLFLSGYAKKTGAALVRIDYPDEVFRDGPAVDAIATDEFGRRVAIEHTILPPFPGQKENLSGSLERVFEPLKRQAVPGRNICITVPDHSIKRGQNWARAAEALQGWFEGAKSSFPLGWSYHILIVPGLRLKVHMVGHCEAVGEQKSCVSIMYSHPNMEEQFADAVAQSVERKVGKLVKTRADRRILLFQREWGAYSSRRLEIVISSLAPRFPKLERVDEIWLADSFLWESHGGSIAFRRVRAADSCSSDFFRTDCE
jgi:hypothetical protein